MQLKSWSLCELTSSRDNNFNLLRLSLALLVIFTHAFGVTGDGRDPMAQYSGLSLGSWAVDGFFVVSGFLITQSWLRSHSFVDYILARCLRVYPGLWVCVGLCCLVLGPILTEIDIKDYFLHIEFWKFLLENSTLLPLGVHTSLPGVFEGQGHGATNVSLWTLPFELKMYLLLLFLAILGCLNRWFLLALILLAAGWYGVNTFAGAELGHTTLVRFVFFFFTGSACFFWRKFICLSDIWAICIIALLALLWIFGGSRNLFLIILNISTPWLILYLALRPSLWARVINRYGDYSYGMYIYAFPVQQLILWFANGQQLWWQNFILSAVSTLLLAILSWHLVEVRALSLRKPLRVRALQLLSKCRSLQSGCR